MENAKTRRVNLEAVAKRAGVGIATVDRVLNERGNVSAKTAHKVLEAARQLHLKRLLPAPYHKIVRLEVLLGRPHLRFLARMSEEFRLLSGSLDRSVLVHRTLLADEAPETMARALRRTRSDATIVYTLEHDAIHEAIETIATRGVPTITIISDLPRSRRHAYAGTDHYQAGRTVGYFIEKMVRQPGPVLVLCNHLGFHAHSLRTRGFGEFLAGSKGGLRVAEIVEGRDDYVLTELVLRDALKRYPETVAVYNVGGGTRGVAAAISSVDPNRRPLFAGHELNDVTRELLLSGVMTMVIDQNPEYQARLAVEMALEALGFVGAPWVAMSRPASLPFTIYCPENV
jgi:LacI family transcriptional regulator